MYTGPKLTNSNLVFGYDTGYGVADNNVATRFYTGEPATNNTITSSYTWNGDGNNQAFSGKGSVAITDENLKYNGYDTVLWTPGSSQNCYLNGSGNINPSDVSTVWTFSCYIKREDGTAITSLNVYLYYPSGDGAAGGTIVDCGNGWYRVSRTRTGSSSYISLAGFTGFSAGNKYYLSGVTLTKTSHAVPYVAVQATRSSTASLIDLKRTTSIDVSNVSFDSTGQPTFDGTNDVITTDFPVSTISNVTIEAVVYRNQATGRYEAIVQNNVVSDDALYVNPSGYLIFWPCASSSLTVPTGQWSHVAVSYNGTTLTYIVNGTIQVVTATCSDITDWDFLRIGGHGTTDGERWIGKIAVAKVYEKSLSAAELTQNYKAYKNRFNL
jgi:hypothetical protein